MSLYYVYMHLARYRKTEVGARGWSSYLLTCESRYVADELFRAYQDLKDSHGQPRFTKLERSNPQFWIYDATGSNPLSAPTDVLWGSPLPPSVDGRVIPTVLCHSSAHEWSIPPIVPGRDWVNGNTYYVRSIRQPNLYWYSTSGGVVVSSGGPQTKFRVVGTDLGSDKRVLIRSDVVRLEIPQTNPVQYLRCGVDNSLRFAPGGEDWTFRFEDLLGKFGIRWLGAEGSWKKGHVKWDAGGVDQDEWELC